MSIPEMLLHFRNQPFILFGHLIFQHRHGRSCSTSSSWSSSNVSRSLMKGSASPDLEVPGSASPDSRASV
eukprot:9545142-Prorocentrum_lima.AAC.1